MSHFAEMKVDFKTKSQAELIKALEEIVGKGNVEVHEEPQDLLLWNGQKATNTTYGKDYQAPPCEIIVRKKHLPLKGMTNDMGFKRQEDGTFAMYADKAGWGDKHTTQLKQEYTANVTEKTLKANGWITKRSMVKGKLVVTGEKP